MEVLDNIFDRLRDDAAALSACSLACHAWLSICRPRLFSKITLDYKGDSCDKLLCALRSSASTEAPIAECVREVKVCTRILTFSGMRDDARTRLTQYASSMLGNWMPQPGPPQISLPNSSVFATGDRRTLPAGSLFAMGDRRTLSRALGPVLHSLPRVERLYMSSFDWNHLAPMSLWEAAMDRTCTSAPLSLFSGLTSVKSITFGLAMFNSPSEVMQLLAQFPNLESLKMEGVVFDPFGTELPACGTPGNTSASGPIRIQKLALDGGSREAARVVHGLLNPPFSMALQEISVYSTGTCDCNTVARLLYAMRSTLEIIRLNFSLSAGMQSESSPCHLCSKYTEITSRCTGLLETIDLSKFPKLRVFELEYEYLLVEADLPGFGAFRSETPDIRHLPVFLRALPESTEELIFRFQTQKRVTSGVPSVYWDFTDWDMLDRVLVALHARVPSLRATFHFKVTPTNPLGPLVKTPASTPDVAGGLETRLRRTLACDGRVARLGSCVYDA